MRMRGLPRVPYLHTVLQVNIRTYVTYKGISGIYFLTIDANKRLAVWGARIGALLPYRKASMRMTTRKDGIHFQSVSRELNQDKEKLDILYHPVSNAYTPSLNSLETGYLSVIAFLSFIIKRFIAEISIMIAGKSSVQM